jgi:hypothetical protein
MPQMKRATGQLQWSFTGLPPARFRSSNTGDTATTIKLDPSIPFTFTQ